MIESFFSTESVASTKMDSNKFSFNLSDFPNLSNSRHWKGEKPPEEPFIDLFPNMDITSYDSLSRCSDESIPIVCSSIQFIDPVVLSSIQFIDPGKSPQLFDLAESSKREEEISDNHLVQLSIHNPPDSTGELNSSAEASLSREQSMTDQLNSTGETDLSYQLDWQTDQLNATASEQLGATELLDSRRLVGLSLELRNKVASELTLYSILFGFDEINGQIREQALQASVDLLDSIMATRLLRPDDNDGSAELFELEYTLKEAVVLQLVKNHQFLRNFEMLTNDAKANLASENCRLLVLLNGLAIKGEQERSATGAH